MCVGGVLWRWKRVSPIELLILLQLRREPLYGYEIIKKLKEEFKGVWEPKTGTIYPALRRLEGRGLIRTEVRDEREYYHITPRGEEALRESLLALEESLSFAGRYFRCLFRHVPPHPRILRVISSGMDLPMLDIESLTGWDREAVLSILKSIREVLKARLKYVESKIRELEQSQ